jgi:hypothetical protein
MAKQTFTTGQVLTAAQMTSLQQTAMGGGSATAKTTSYVLVAADAGGTVAMNAAGATTITVNTGLFAAGDTVFIQNLGAGATTITAGTATVSTAGSLILPQYDAGILYFTATGASIFYDYIQAGAASPLTTKGDVYTFSTSDARLGVGANNTVLTADSGEATGLKWTAPAGAGLVLIKTQTIGTGVSSVAVTSAFSAAYDNYKIIISGGVASADVGIHLKLGSTTSAYYVTLAYNYANGGAGTFSFASLANHSEFVGMGDGCVNSLTANMEINSPNLSKPTSVLNHSVKTITSNAQLSFTQGFLDNTTSYTDFTVISGSGGVTFTGGTIKVYGYAN